MWLIQLRGLKYRFKQAIHIKEEAGLPLSSGRVQEGHDLNPNGKDRGFREPELLQGMTSEPWQTRDGTHSVGNTLGMKPRGL